MLYLFNIFNIIFIYTQLFFFLPRKFISTIIPDFNDLYLVINTSHQVELKPYFIF